MAPTEVAIWTEHDQKTINSATTPCTMIMYRTISNKFISGVYVPSLLFKSGSNAPVWNSSYQSNGNGFLDAANLTQWRLPNDKLPYHKHETPTTITNRLLLAGSTAQKITSQDTSFSSTNYKSTFANFADTTFSIGTGLQIANATGGLHSSIATDKLAEMTLNDFTSSSNNNNIYDRTYNSSDLDDYKNESVTFEPIWSGAVIAGNFWSVGIGKDITLPTLGWINDSLVLHDIGIFDGDNCVGINLGTISGNTENPQFVSTLPNMNWTESENNTSIYDITQESGNPAEIIIATSVDDANTTAIDGHIVGNTPSCYIRVTTNTSVSSTNNTAGTYILKCNITNANNMVGNGAITKFNAGDTGITMKLSIPNMTITMNCQRINGYNAEDKGAILKLKWTTNSNLTQVYNQTSSNTLNTTGLNNVIFTENIRRIRTDTGNNDQDVLYLGNADTNAISILPDKIWATNSENYIVDTYGLWFNATYKYYIDCYNVITGETLLNQTTFLSTLPGTPIHWEEVVVTEVGSNPSIITKWQNPSATGAASSISYTFTRSTVTVNGYDISNNIDAPNATLPGHGKVISSSGTDAGGVSVGMDSYDITTTHNDTLLYGKTISCSLQTKTASNLVSATITQSFTVPTGLYVDDASLNYQIDASQNSITTIYQSIDCLGRTLSYQEDYIAITVPTSYTFTNTDDDNNDTECTEYQIFEKYKLIATIPIADVEASNGTIILSKYWSNSSANTLAIMSDWGASNPPTPAGVYLNVVAANPVVGKYTAVGTTKYILNLPQPDLPPSHPVTDISANGMQNAIEITWNYPEGTLDKNQPSSYNYIDKVNIYAIINPSAGHYESMNPTYDFDALNITDASDISANVYVLIGTISNASNGNFNTRSFLTNRNNSTYRLWDNEIVGYRIVTQNEQENYSIDSNGNIRWGTTQAGGLVDVSTGYTTDGSYNSAFSSTYVQAKTNGPTAARQVSLLGSGSWNQITPSWTVPTNQPYYSNDTSLVFGVSYEYISTIAGTTLSADNSEIYPSPSSPTQEIGSTLKSKTNKSLTDLVPGATYTVYSTVYTNMQDLQADDNNWTANIDGANSKSYTVAQSSTPNHYRLVEPLVYKMSTTATDKISWELSTYTSQNNTASSGGTYQISSPPFMYPEWRNHAVMGGDNVCVINLDRAIESSITITDNDVIAVFGKDSGGRCLDAIQWSTTENNKFTMKQDNYGITTAENELYFLLWTVSTKKLTSLYVIQSNFDKTDSAGVVIPNYTGPMDFVKLSDGVYTIKSFTIPDYNYRIYKNGVLHTTETNISPTNNIYDYGISDGQADIYDVTLYITDKSGDATRSGSYGTTFSATNESKIWIAPSSSLVEQSPIIRIDNPIKSNVAYDSSNLFLGSAQTQSIEFTSGIWSFISFNTVDASNTTIKNIINLISSGTSTITKILMFDEVPTIYEKIGDTWTTLNKGDPDDNINYDKAYYVKVITGDGNKATLSVTGVEIRGIYMNFTTGPNFTGMPTITANEEASNIMNKLIKDSASTTLWEMIVIIFGNSTVLPNETNTYIQDRWTFKVASGYVIDVINGFELLLGTDQALRHKGDFDSSGTATITSEDLYALAKYLVKISPHFTDIGDAITSEGNANNYWANLKSADGTAVGINDLVYLTSMVNSVTGYTNFPETGDQQAPLS